MNPSLLKYVIALVLYGSNGIIASLIQMNSYEIVMFRMFIGASFLVCIFLISGRKFTFYKKKKSFLFLTLSGFAMGISSVLVFEAYNHIGVGLATLGYLSFRISVCLQSL